MRPLMFCRALPIKREGEVWEEHFYWGDGEDVGGVGEHRPRPLKDPFAGRGFSRVPSKRLEEGSQAS